MFQPIRSRRPASISTTSGGDGKLGSGWPYVAYSFFSLNTAAWIGMPVQWNANGKSFFPYIRLVDANSAFVIGRAWPMVAARSCRYGKVTRNLPLALRAVVVRERARWQ